MYLIGVLIKMGALGSANDILCTHINAIAVGINFCIVANWSKEEKHSNYKTGRMKKIKSTFDLSL